MYFRLGVIIFNIKVEWSLSTSYGAQGIGFSLTLPLDQYKYCWQVVKEAIACGIDGYDTETKNAVRKAAYGLRLTRDVAMTIASKAVSIRMLILVFWVVKVL